MAEQQRQQRQQQNPAAAMITGAVVVLLLLGGGWWMWSVSDTKRVAPVTLNRAPATSPGGVGGADNTPRTPRDIAMSRNPLGFTASGVDGVRETGPDAYQVKGGRLFANVFRRDDGQWGFRFVYPYREFLTREQTAMLRSRWQVNQLRNHARRLALTPGQLKALEEFPPHGDVAVSGEERRTVAELFKAYADAAPEAKPRAEREVVAAVRAIDDGMHPVMLDRMEATAAAIRRIYTDEQVSAVVELFMPAPATRAAPPADVR